MCAIFGWLDYKGKVPQKLLRKLTQSLANAAEERGTDAAGISYVKDGKVTIYKRPKPAHKVKFRLPDGTRAVMGHTRFATQGDKKLNFNNHPFYGYADKNFAFAHNGVLYNDSTLRKEKKLPPTNIETDSYVAVQLIEKRGKLDLDSLKSMAEDVCGSFVFTILDEENTLYFVKGSNPLCLLHFEELGLYVYASTETIMASALKAVGLEKCSCSQIKLVDGDMLSIDKNGNVANSEFEAETYSFYSGFKYTDYTYFDDEDEVETLLEMCGMFGYTEEDVYELLSYGFTCTEIEDMFMEPQYSYNSSEVHYG